MTSLGALLVLLLKPADDVSMTSGNNTGLPSLHVVGVFVLLIVWLPVHHAYKYNSKL